MKQNVTFSIGNLALVEKVDGELDGYLDRVFGNVGGKAKDFVPCVKLLMYNRLGDCLPVSRLDDYPPELFDRLGFEKPLSHRTFNRTVERIGKSFPFVLLEHQKILKEYDLVSKEQLMDFSSSYFEGNASPLGAKGYSRDGKPGKKQIAFGISTGIDNIPSALTIQKGNVQDRKHFRIMLRTAKAVLEKGSVLIYDCGANTKKNRELVRDAEFHYITLKAKKVGPYKKLVAIHKAQDKKVFELNKRPYSCVKIRRADGFRYIYFSEKLYQDQIRKKTKKLEKELEKNRTKLKKIMAGKPLEKLICEDGFIITKGILQKIIDGIPNPYINGIEGYFVLESSIDTEPEKILSLYKNRDKAEKLIRNMKEGTEMRPIRHWSDWAVIGYVIIIFLTNFLVNLTLNKAKKPLVKNVKLLKKYLMNLTLTVVYPPKGFRFHIVSNISEEIRSIFGNYIDKYQDKSLKMRW